ncbi:O-antigen ligase [Ruminococcaceae bacterium R-25]|nr:O-antigen ligase [Ruminococcaceae bacterium R-25]SUQ11329.1 O-antigen ligase [Oscillospiraceae bacterium]
MDTFEKQKNAYIKALCFYLFCLPLNALSIGTFGSLLKLIAFVPVVIAYMRFRILRRYRQCVIFQLLFVLFACFSIAWSVNTSLSIDRSISYVLLYLLIFTGTFFEVDSYDIKKIKNGFLWSTRTTAIVMLLFSNFSRGRWFLSSKISEDPNYLCCYLVAGIIILLQRIQKSEKKRISYIELILYLVLVVATGSRGGLLAIATGILAYLFSSKKRLPKELAKIFGAIILIIAAFAIILYFMPESLRERYSLNTIINSQGVGRYAIWEEGIRVFKESSFITKFFGAGTGTVTSIIQIFEYGKMHGYVMHNIFLETLIETGIIGLLIYLFAIGSFIRASYKFQDKFSFAVIISMVTLSFSTSLHTFKPYFNIMLFIILLLYSKPNHVDNDPGIVVP